MKKKYMSPAINVVKIESKLMNDIIISSGNADMSDVGSKRGTINFTDDDDDDYATGW